MPRGSTPKKPSIPFDDLPLFVFKDSDLAEAIVGPDPERKQLWLAGLARLEACGFPKVTPGMGRYRPAVKSFYDHFYDHSRYLTAQQSPEPRGELGTWTPRKRTRPQV